MKFNFIMNQEEKKSYLNQLNMYLTKEKEKCEEFKDNKFFITTKDFIDELEKNVCMEKLDEDAVSFDRRAKKYLNFVEAYRLARYQYSKYSDKRKSMVEGVYSAMIAEIIKEKKKKVFDNIRIMDVGCGPSRMGMEMAEIFENASIDLFDFSIINLFLAQKIISGNQFVHLPYRSFCDDLDKTSQSDIDLLSIKGIGAKNVNFNIIDLSKGLERIDNNSYEIITATHSLNLLPDPKKVILELIDKLNEDGILVISDLLGWKEDRDEKRRIFSDRSSFYQFFDKLETVEIIEFYSGGPYCEEVNQERVDQYINHLIVLKKVKIV